MANNRMYLRNKRTGQQVFLAKYYPSTGWYCYHEDLNHRLDKLFSDPRHVEGSDLGGNDYEVVYESICEPTSEQLSKGRSMERPTCKTCPYWKDQWQDDGGNPEDIGFWGRCHRNAPQVVLYVPEDDDIEKYAKWPTTNGDQWCGEHPDFPAYITSLKTPDTPRGSLDKQDMAELEHIARNNPIHSARFATDHSPGPNSDT